MDGPVIDGRAPTFTFGRQLDVRTIRSADFDSGQELTERAVASYIAKYATKGAETATGALDRPLKFLAELAQLDISDHARRLIRTAWALGARKELEDLRLRAWAHMLGFRGHFSTKSRRYSTTLGALRAARAEWRRAQAAAATEGDTGTTLVVSHWSSPEPVCPPPKPGLPHPSNPPPEQKENRSVADRYLTVAQVAELLGTTERFPRRLIAERRIVFVKVGRHVRIPRARWGPSSRLTPFSRYAGVVAPCGGLPDGQQEGEAQKLRVLPSARLRPVAGALPRSADWPPAPG
ncbi:hypothetical protein SAV31267_056540 [Streptomyces avermitilis]|uniref:Helix-turn-helix domain-containing protein n=1 Tax=Streptomyces avermitilis TaxID=33903 RepID=A0A4D4MXW0_STRAX|nr:hypothetical protein SAV31267_056540 [Streptomyces avermitilis]